ncbi:uncharacterized protein LY89DRAFT_784647 [Mollisia scopiformis]|uniref:NACHT domain-containing protein n=1 Tax=Mollisia scopiformis TaxID=149040 RepID=A0A194X0Q5_MOLSC|nr:uncharacterized protein LY89DRAFT_784647 [Mollisia scopiformis]KUJ13781.1 hypothetical protein LY89DRAFT_784647 [Mollisia scopiformis]
MAEALAALGLASNIVQFVSFASDLISKSRAISKSTDSGLVENLELEAISSTLHELNHGLLRALATGASSSTAEKILQELCKGCGDVMEELLEVIQSLKSQGPHTRWNSFRQALKSVWKEDQIKALSTRLDRYRNQIDTTLLMSLRENIVALQTHLVAQNSTLEATQKTSVDQLHSSMKSIEQWQSEVLGKLLLNDWQSKNQLDAGQLSSQLSATAGQQREEIMKLKILESLRYNDIKERLERIPSAYSKTFHWIFDEDGPAADLNSADEIVKPENVAEARDQTKHTWDNYLHWLQSDDDLYWITGKPGSGKSTLMKYLHADPRTREHLRSWSGDLDLIVAGFFFWNSGSAMQMSERGLIQTLLYQAISKRLELVPMLFPDRWRYNQLFGNDFRPWVLSELNQALETLVSDCSKRLLLFVDGVDEFEGDAMKLAGFLLSLSAQKNVKMCVASRPWLAFEDAFKGSPSLRLEHLTAPDIKIFVLDNLSKSEVFLQLQKLKRKEADDLVLQITQKAQGVFLWVHLVVQSLLEGMRDGDSLADLQERLVYLPSGLEELFKKILGCIDARYLQQASRYFQLVRTASEPLSLLTFSYAEDGIDVAMCAKMQASELEETLQLDRNEMLAEILAEKMFRAENMRRRINSRSKGLLEAPDFKTQGYEATVQYLHRTVKDFLAQDKTGKLLQSWLSDPFDADLHMCAGYMIGVKRIDISPWIDQGLDRISSNRLQENTRDWNRPNQDFPTRRTGILLPSTFRYGRTARGETTWCYILSKASANDHQSIKTQWPVIIGILLDGGADPKVKVNIFAAGKRSLADIVKENAYWWSQDPADIERLRRVLVGAQKKDKVARWQPGKWKSISGWFCTGPQYDRTAIGVQALITMTAAHSSYFVIMAEGLRASNVIGTVSEVGRLRAWMEDFRRELKTSSEVEDCDELNHSSHATHVE